MPPSPDQPLTSFDKAVAYALIALLIALSVAGVRMNQGHPPRQVWVLMQAGLVLLLGLAFYLLTRGSKGQIHLKDAGVRLGGPVAIGLGVVLVLHSLFPWEEGCRARVIDVPGLAPQDVVEIYKSHGVAARELGPQRILVEFIGEARQGWVAVRRPDFQAQKWSYTRFDFAREGRLETREVTEEEVNAW